MLQYCREMTRPRTISVILWSNVRGLQQHSGSIKDLPFEGEVRSGRRPQASWGGGPGACPPPGNVCEMNMC